MKNKKLLYIPAAILFVIAMSVLATHYSRLYNSLSQPQRAYEIPFGYFEYGVVNLDPAGEQAGISVGDKIIAFNGETVKSSDDLYKKFNKINSFDPIKLEIERNAADGSKINKKVEITPTKFEKDINYYSSLLLLILFGYILPTLCILLGCWVLFVRPQDPVAWFLFFLLCGFTAVSLEGYADTSVVGIFRSITSNSWALAMFLFGIYFPERWSIDKRFPWAKWILIVPLAVQIILVLIENIGLLFGMELEYIRSGLPDVIKAILGFANIPAVLLFFIALTHKAFTLRKSDSGRRLKLMVAGTIISVLPVLFIVIYKDVSNTPGSFFDTVPTWFAAFALLMLLLFPITMAYVIVVQRAMNVSVVVRQGLQYALAKNGVLALQILLSIVVILTAVSFATGTETNRPQKIIFIAVGIMFVFLIRLLADKIRVWVDRKFFREAYNAEQILTDLSEEVRTMVETKPLLEKVSNKISESLHVPQVTLLLKNGNSFQPAYAVGYENAPSATFNKDDKTIEKISKNEPFVIYQDVVDSRVDSEIQIVEREALKQLNSQLLLPIGVKNELAGIISLSPKLSEEPFTPNDLRLLKSVASQTGLALENSRLTETIAREAAQKERLNRELEIAREVQERLFPQKLPKIENLDYFGACRSALDVGGDYYDFLELADGKFGIAIGDISGKGIGASLMMASLQASLRGQTLHFKDDLAGLLSQMNSLLYEASTSNRYATFFYSQFDPETLKLTYVNAGHNPPYLLRPNEVDFEVLTLEAGGAVVGMLPPMLVSYEQGEIKLQKGDLIVGSTDGISEAMNPKEEEWGEEAMVEELKKVHHKSAEEILEYIVARADEFAGGARQHDDMTMIVVKVV